MKPNQRLTVVLFYLLVFFGVIIISTYLMEAENEFTIYLIGIEGFVLLIIFFVNLNTWLRRANRRVAKNRRKMGM